MNKTKIVEATVTFISDPTMNKVNVILLTDDKTLLEASGFLSKVPGTLKAGDLAKFYIKEVTGKDGKLYMNIMGVKTVKSYDPMQAAAVIPPPPPPPPRPTPGPSGSEKKQGTRKTGSGKRMKRAQTPPTIMDDEFLNNLFAEQ